MVVKLVKKMWFEKEPDLYARIQAEITSIYPLLHFVTRDRKVYVVGSIPLVFDGVEIDCYQIEIELPDGFPRGIPRARETAKRIPRIADRHMYTDGTMCLFVDEEWINSNPNGTDLLTFLDGPVRNFFIGQSLVERGGGWPFGQRSHGVEGILECYAELVGTTNLPTAYRYLGVLSKKKIKGHWLCPCGSGKKIRDCHKKTILNLRQRIPRQVVQRSWQQVQIERHRNPTGSLFVRNLIAKSS